MSRRFHLSKSAHRKTARAAARGWTIKRPEGPCAWLRSELKKRRAR
jgi:hypothetical protein